LFIKKYDFKNNLSVTTFLRFFNKGPGKKKKKSIQAQLFDQVTFFPDPKIAYEVVVPHLTRK